MLGAGNLGTFDGHETGRIYEFVRENRKSPSIELVTPEQHSHVIRQACYLYTFVISTQHDELAARETIDNVSEGVGVLISVIGGIADGRHGCIKCLARTPYTGQLISAN